MRYARSILIEFASITRAFECRANEEEEIEIQRNQSRRISFHRADILLESFAWNFEFSHDSPELSSAAALMQNVAYKIAWKFLSSNRNVQANY